VAGVDDLLDGLDASQREAVTVDAAPIAILAGAGSGKTRVLTRRIAWHAREGLIDPEHVLALTFTRKAAGELVTRLRRLGVPRQVAAGTFHALALAQLRRRCDDRGVAMPAVLDRKVPLLLPLLGTHGRGQGRAQTALLAGQVASEIEWAKARLVRPDHFESAAVAADRRSTIPPAELATIYERYEQQKRKRRALDFDDLIWWCADALLGDAEFGAAQRWRFRRLFVDEFQDVSPAQLRLVRAWLGERPDLCVVGDPDQAIYGFAGADTDHLNRFAHHFPGGTVVRLAGNYRSSPQVVATARAVFSTRDSRTRSSAVQAHRPDGPVPSIAAYDDDAAEAAGAAAILRRERGADRRWSSMAVLYRTNAQSVLFERALRAASIPFRVRGDARFLERPGVRAALEQLRHAERAARTRSFARHLDDLEADDDPGDEEQREHVETIVRLGHEYVAAEGESGTVDGFVAYLRTSLRDDDPGATQPGVELLTFHRAKGLEWDTVVVTGLERGLVPISHARETEAREEDRRLLYVALSRAERALHLTWAQERTFGKRTSARSPSPWLAPIEAAVDRLRGGDAPRSDAGAHAVRARASLPKPAGAALPTEEPLYQALVEWRRNLARASSVPAYVIFHDSTLAAVTEARPASQAELLAISGIGPVKAARYAVMVLRIVGEHAQQPEAPSAR